MLPSLNALPVDETTYPSFGDRIRLYQTPLGGYVVLSSGSSHDELLFPVSVPQFAFLRKIDGLTSLRGLLQDSNAPSGLALVVSLANLNGIILSDTPQSRVPPLAGSGECFVPFHIILELTNGCNLACKHCYVSASAGRSLEIPSPLALRILQESSNLGVDSIQLSGGEPLLHPEFETILADAYRRFRRVSVSTNGTLLSPELVKRLSYTSDKITVQVSIDSAYEHQHDQIRKRRGAFRASIAALGALAAHGFDTRVCISVFPDTTRQLQELVALLGRLGVRRISYVPVMPWGRGRHVAWPKESPDAIHRCLVDECRLQREHGSIIDLVTLNDLRSLRPNCGAGTRLAAIDAKGDVLLCPTMRIVLGSLQRESLAAVLASAVVRRLATLEAPGDSNCSGCPSLLYCMPCISRGLTKAASAKDRCAWSISHQEELAAITTRSPVLCPQATN